MERDDMKASGEYVVKKDWKKPKPYVADANDPDVQTFRLEAAKRGIIASNL